MAAVKQALGLAGKTVYNEGAAAVAVYAHYFVPVGMKSFSAMIIRKWRIHWRPTLSVMWRYAKVELVPPTPAELAKVPGMAKSMVAKDYKSVTTREMCKNLFVCIDVILCFFVGEVIGRQCLQGYNIPNATGVHPLEQSSIRYMWVPTETELAQWNKINGVSK